MTTETPPKQSLTTWGARIQSVLISKREEEKPPASGWPIIGILELAFPLEESEARITFQSKKKLTLECGCNTCLATRGNVSSLRMRTSTCIGFGLKISKIVRDAGIETVVSQQGVKPRCMYLDLIFNPKPIHVEVRILSDETFPLVAKQVLQPHSNVNFFFD